MKLSRSLVFLAVATLAGGQVFAADPAAYLERAQVLAADSQIKTYRVPTTDANGKVGYWDLTIDLGVATNGRPESVAISRLVKSPRFSGSDFLAGTYLDPYEQSCSVSTSFLDSGRQEGAISCPSQYRFSASWANGPLAGHPFELDLRAAGMDKISGFENYAWGKVGFESNAGSLYGCFDTNDIVSARQVGNQITLSSYGADNIADCGVTFTLQQ